MTEEAQTVVYNESPVWECVACSHVCHDNCCCYIQCERCGGFACVEHNGEVDESDGVPSEVMKLKRRENDVPWAPNRGIFLCMPCVDEVSP